MQTTTTAEYRPLRSPHYRALMRRLISHQARRPRHAWSSKAVAALWTLPAIRRAVQP